MVYSGGFSTTDIQVLTTPRLIDNQASVLDTVVPDETIETILVETDTPSIWSRLRYDRIFLLVLVLALIVWGVWYFARKR